MFHLVAAGGVSEAGLQNRYWSDIRIVTSDPGTLRGRGLVKSGVVWQEVNSSNHGNLD